MEAGLQWWICDEAPLVTIAFILGIGAWWLTSRLAFLVGALLIVANWPWTLFGILPTNKVLMATGPENADTQSRALIIKWSKLHSVRTLLGGLAILFFLIGLSSK